MEIEIENDFRPPLREARPSEEQETSSTRAYLLRVAGGPLPKKPAADQWTPPNNFNEPSDGMEKSEEDSIQRLNFFWVLISCGYMVSWTSIGREYAAFKFAPLLQPRMCTQL